MARRWCAALLAGPPRRTRSRLQAEAAGGQGVRCGWGRAGGGVGWGGGMLRLRGPPSKRLPIRRGMMRLSRRTAPVAGPPSHSRAQALAPLAPAPPAFGAGFGLISRGFADFTRFCVLRREPNPTPGIRCFPLFSPDTHASVALFSIPTCAREDAAWRQGPQRGSVPLRARAGSARVACRARFRQRVEIGKKAHGRPSARRWRIGRESNPQNS